MKPIPDQKVEDAWVEELIHPYYLVEHGTGNSLLKVDSKSVFIWVYGWSYLCPSKLTWENIVKLTKAVHAQTG